MFSSDWHTPTVVKAQGWSVSDNGENVVAFAKKPSRQQVDFGRSESLWAVVGLIDKLGSEEFARKANALDNDPDWSYSSVTLADFA